MAREIFHERDGSRKEEKGDFVNTRGETPLFRTPLLFDSKVIGRLEDGVRKFTGAVSLTWRDSNDPPSTADGQVEG